MTQRLASRLAVGLPTLLLWALLAGSALWWWLRAGQPVAPPQAPVAGGAPAALTVDSAQVARALGATAAAPAAPAAAPELGGRLALKGVVTHGGQGAALIALDGKPARPLRVGALLEGAGLAPFFDAAVDSHDVGVEKPDPRIFGIALGRVAAQPAEAAHVGDMYHIDVVGARAAGVTPVLIDPLDLQPAADCARVRSLTELADRLLAG